MWAWYSDSLRAGQSRDRIPVGARFSAHIQTGPEAHLLYNGYCVFPGGKAAGAWLYHPPHPGLRLKKEYSYTYTPPLGLRGLF